MQSKLVAESAGQRTCPQSSNQARRRSSTFDFAVKGTVQCAASQKITALGAFSKGKLGWFDLDRQDLPPGSHWRNAVPSARRSPSTIARKPSLHTFSIKGIA
jgi:hypothetical protein